jgi:transcription elongation factor Elf1
MNPSGRATGLLPELLPCPFCGGRLLKGRRFGQPGYLHTVKCDSCEIGMSSISPSCEAAINLYNTRANRWSAFSDEELKDISLTYSPFGRQPKFFEETKAELSRRHATGEGEI